MSTASRITHPFSPHRLASISISPPPSLRLSQHPKAPP
ncbi:hypothetical protein, partial [Cerasicoccus arenae]